jgi:YidC/Oxa1 family membrane protein insertase
MISALGALYHEAIYRPLINALIVLYNTVAFGDLGIAIILLTILVRIALYPLFEKSLHHTMKMQAIQPRLKALQEEHKSNKEKQAEEMIALFKEHGTNPLSFFFFTLAQLPILFALYHLFSQGLGTDYANGLYALVAKPEELHNTFLGLINLNQPNTIVVGIMAIAQYLQARVVLPKPADPKALTAQEKKARWNALIPAAVIAALFSAYGIPSAVGLYLTVSGLFSTAQQIFMKKRA